MGQSGTRGWINMQFCACVVMVLVLIIGRNFGQDICQNNDIQSEPRDRALRNQNNRGSEDLPRNNAVYKWDVTYNTTACAGRRQMQRCTLMAWEATRSLQKYLGTFKIDEDNPDLVVDKSKVAPGFEYMVNLTVMDGGKAVRSLQFVLSENKTSQKIMDGGDGTSAATTRRSKPQILGALELFGPGKIYADVDLYIVAKIILCVGNIDDAKMQWEILSDTGQVIRNLSYTGTQLMIPSQTFIGGTKCRVRGTATLNATTVIGTAYHNLEVGKRGISVRLNAKTLSIGVNEPVRIIATIYNPDNSDTDFDLEWSCKFETENCDKFEGNTAILELESGFSKPGRYEIVIKVVEGGVTKQDTCVVYVQQKVSRSVEVYEYTKAVDLSDVIEISAKVTKLVTGCLVEWKSLAEEGYSTVDLNAMPGYSGMTNVTIREDSFLSELAESENDTSDRDFTLSIPPKNGNWAGLKGDVAYLFRLMSSCPLDAGDCYADIPLTTNTGPQVQLLQVTPTSGIALTTKFTFNTTKAEDIPSDYPILYKFGYEFKNKSLYFATVSDFYSAETILPYSDLGIQTILKCCDSRGSCTLIKGPVVDVKIPDNISEIQESQLRQHFAAMLARGDYEHAGIYATSLLETYKSFNNDLLQTDMEEFVRNSINDQFEVMLGPQTVDETFRAAGNDLIKSTRELAETVKLPEKLLTNIIKLKVKISDRTRERIVTDAADIDHLLELLNNFNSRNSRSFGLEDVKDYLETLELVIRQSEVPKTVEMQKDNVIVVLDRYMGRLCSLLYGDLKTMSIELEKLSTNHFSSFAPIPHAANPTGKVLKIKFVNDWKDLIRGERLCLVKGVLRDYLQRDGYTFLADVYDAMTYGRFEPNDGDLGSNVLFELTSEEVQTCSVFDRTQWNRCARVKQRATNLLCKCDKLGYFGREVIDYEELPTRSPVSSTSPTTIQTTELGGIATNNADSPLNTTPAVVFIGESTATSGSSTSISEVTTQGSRNSDSDPNNSQASNSTTNDQPSSGNGNSGTIGDTSAADSPLNTTPAVGFIGESASTATSGSSTSITQGSRNEPTDSDPNSSQASNSTTNDQPSSGNGNSGTIGDTSGTTGVPLNGPSAEPTTDVPNLITVTSNSVSFPASANVTFNGTSIPGVPVTTAAEYIGNSTSSHGGLENSTSNPNDATLPTTATSFSNTDAVGAGRVDNSSGTPDASSNAGSNLDNTIPPINGVTSGTTIATNIDTTGTVSDTNVTNNRDNTATNTTSIDSINTTSVSRDNADATVTLRNNTTGEGSDSSNNVGTTSTRIYDSTAPTNFNSGGSETAGASVPIDNGTLGVSLSAPDASSQSTNATTDGNSPPPSESTFPTTSGTNVNTVSTDPGSLITAPSVQGPSGTNNGNSMPDDSTTSTATSDDSNGPITDNSTIIQSGTTVTGNSTTDGSKFSGNSTADGSNSTGTSTTDGTTATGTIDGSTVIGNSTTDASTVTGISSDVSTISGNSTDASTTTGNSTKGGSTSTADGSTPIGTSTADDSTATGTLTTNDPTTTRNLTTGGSNAMGTATTDVSTPTGASTMDGLTTTVNSTGSTPIGTSTKDGSTPTGTLTTDGSGTTGNANATSDGSTANGNDNSPTTNGLTESTASTVSGVSGNNMSAPPSDSHSMESSSSTGTASVPSNSLGGSDLTTAVPTVSDSTPSNSASDSNNDSDATANSSFTPSANVEGATGNTSSSSANEASGTGSNYVGASTSSSSTNEAATGLLPGTSSNTTSPTTVSSGPNILDSGSSSNPSSGSVATNGNQTNTESTPTTLSPDPNIFYSSSASSGINTSVVASTTSVGNDDLNTNLMGSRFGTDGSGTTPTGGSNAPDSANSGSVLDDRAPSTVSNYAETNPTESLSGSNTSISSDSVGSGSSTGLDGTNNVENTPTGSSRGGDTVSSGLANSTSDSTNNVGTARVGSSEEATPSISSESVIADSVSSGAPLTKSNFATDNIGTTSVTSAGVLTPSIGDDSHQSEGGASSTNNLARSSDLSTSSILSNISGSDSELEGRVPSTISTNVTESSQSTSLDNVTASSISTADPKPLNYVTTLPENTSLAGISGENLSESTTPLKSVSFSSNIDFTGTGSTDLSERFNGVSPDELDTNLLNDTRLPPLDSATTGTVDGHSNKGTHGFIGSGSHTHRIMTGPESWTTLGTASVSSKTNNDVTGLPEAPSTTSANSLTPDFSASTPTGSDVSTSLSTNTNVSGLLGGGPVNADGISANTASTATRSDVSTSLSTNTNVSGLPVNVSLNTTSTSIGGTNTIVLGLTDTTGTNFGSDSVNDIDATTEINGVPLPTLSGTSVPTTSSGNPESSGAAFTSSSASGTIPEASTSRQAKSGSNSETNIFNSTAFNYSANPGIVGTTAPADSGNSFAATPGFDGAFLTSSNNLESGINPSSAPPEGALTPSPVVNSGTNPSGTISAISTNPTDAIMSNNVSSISSPASGNSTGGSNPGGNPTGTTSPASGNPNYKEDSSTTADLDLAGGTSNPLSVPPLPNPAGNGNGTTQLPSNNNNPASVSPGDNSNTSSATTNNNVNSSPNNPRPPIPTNASGNNSVSMPANRNVNVTKRNNATEPETQSLSERASIKGNQTADKIQSANILSASSMTKSDEISLIIIGLSILGIVLLGVVGAVMNRVKRERTIEATDNVDFPKYANVFHQDTLESVPH